MSRAPDPENPGSNTNQICDHLTRASLDQQADKGPVKHDYLSNWAFGRTLRMKID
jgi:hypothetical protein